MSDTLPRITNHHFFTEPSCAALYLRLTLKFLARGLAGIRRSIALVIAEGFADFRVPHTFLAFSIGIRFFGGPAFEFRLTDLVLLAFLLAF